MDKGEEGEALFIIKIYNRKSEGITNGPSTLHL